MWKDRAEDDEVLPPDDKKQADKDNKPGHQQLQKQRADFHSFFLSLGQHASR